MTERRVLHRFGRHQLFLVLAGTLVLYAGLSAVVLFWASPDDGHGDTRAPRTYIAVPRNDLDTLRDHAFMESGLALLDPQNKVQVTGSGDGSGAVPSDDGAVSSRAWWDCGHGPAAGNKTAPSRPRGVLPGLKRLVYSRIHRTGSAMFTHLLEELAFEHEFRLVAHTESSASTISLAATSPVARREIARAVAHGTYKNVAAFGGGSHVMHTGVVGTGRVAFAGFGVFLDFIKEGYRQPIHVTLLREPLERAASEFGALVQDRVTRAQLCPGIRPTSTFNDCVSLMRDGKCGREGCGPVNPMTRTLCGAEPECQDPSSEAALRKALISLQYRYAVVGIDEEMELSLELLESALPEWFEGAAAHYAMLPAFNVRAAGRQRSRAAVMLLSGPNAAFLRRVHRNDRQLYKAAVALLHQRIQVCREGEHGGAGVDVLVDANADSAADAVEVAQTPSGEDDAVGSASSEGASSDTDSAPAGALRATVERSV